MGGGLAFESGGFGGGIAFDAGGGGGGDGAVVQAAAIGEAATGEAFGFGGTEAHDAHEVLELVIGASPGPVGSLPQGGSSSKYTLGGGNCFSTAPAFAAALERVEFCILPGRGAGRQQAHAQNRPRSVRLKVPKMLRMCAYIYIYIYMWQEPLGNIWS